MRDRDSLRPSYRDLLETSAQRINPSDALVGGHLQSRGGGGAIILIAVLIIGAVLIPPLVSLLSLF